MRPVVIASLLTLAGCAVGARVEARRNYEDAVAAYRACLTAHGARGAFHTSGGMAGTAALENSQGSLQTDHNPVSSPLQFATSAMLGLPRRSS
jgi:hypothetical protein